MVVLCTDHRWRAHLGRSDPDSSMVVGTARLPSPILFHLTLGLARSKTPGVNEIIGDAANLARPLDTNATNAERSPLSDVRAAQPPIGGAPRVRQGGPSRLLGDRARGSPSTSLLCGPVPERPDWHFCRRVGPLVSARSTPGTGGATRFSVSSCSRSRGDS